MAYADGVTPDWLTLAIGRRSGVPRRNHHVVPRWGTTAIRAVNVADVEDWLAAMTARGLAASSMRQAYRVLSLILDHAVRAGRLARNPAARASLPPARRVEKCFLSHAEVERLAVAAGPYRLAGPSPGCRFGELAALRAGRVNLLRRRLDIAESVTEVDGVAVFGTPKTHHRRSVPIPRSLVEPLAHQIAGWPASALLFTAPEGECFGLATSASGSSTVPSARLASKG
jgi:integrase